MADIWESIGPIATDKPLNLNLQPYIPFEVTAGATTTEAKNYVAWVNKNFKDIKAVAAYVVAANPGNGNYVLPLEFVDGDTKVNILAELNHANGNKVLVNVGQELLTFSTGRMSANYRISQLIYRAESQVTQGQPTFYGSDPALKVAGSLVGATEAVESASAAAIRELLGVKRSSKKAGV